MFHLLLTLVRLYSYDAVGRRAGEVASDGPSVTMGYSLAGSIASMTTADSGSCARVQVAAGVAGDVAGISSLASGWTPVVMDPTAEVPTVVGVGEMPVPTPGVSMLGAHASGGSGVRGTSSSVLAGGAGVVFVAGALYFVVEDVEGECEGGGGEGEGGDRHLNLLNGCRLLLF